MPWRTPSAAVEVTGPPQTQAGESHADLRHREQASGICQQAESGLGTGVSLFRHLAEAGLAYREKRGFSGRKKPIDGND